jgi:adenosine/AMP kinase
MMSWIVVRHDPVEGAVQLDIVPVAIPDNANVVIGQTHFVKTVEDLYEIMVTSVPQAAFGIAFNEASGPCLIRADGNDADLRIAAIATAEAIGAGHAFVVYMRNAYPINVLNRIKDCPEVCHIFCATANPLQVIVASTEQGRGIMGVVDGSSPAAVEQDADRECRIGFLRKIGYKR